ncbi:MAG: GNAT family N-acetyltransferase [Prevotellaceae bacterium]|jgi:putative acetyltransferase|nr:GNAT family N-acetyltransferase [Prevotellaceae bacterium]
MQDKITVKEISEGDNKLLASIIRTVFEEYDAPREGTVYSDSATDNLFEIFQKPESVLWVARVNDNIAGCCGIYPTEGLEKGYAELVKFYLTKNSRGKGIGKILMEKSIQSAQYFGYKYLYLESFPQFSKAIDIYEKQGFERIDHQLGFSGHSACNIWMLKRIN